MKKIKISIVITLLLVGLFSCREGAHLLSRALCTIKYWSGNISAASVIESNSRPDMSSNSCDSAFTELESGGSYSIHGDIYNVHEDMEEIPPYDSDISNEITKVLSTSKKVQVEEGSNGVSPVVNNCSFEVIRLLEDGNWTGSCEWRQPVLTAYQNTISVAYKRKLTLKDNNQIYEW